jgi:hypothetical protein
MRSRVIAGVGSIKQADRLLCSKYDVVRSTVSSPAVKAFLVNVPHKNLSVQEERDISLNDAVNC